MTPSTCLVFECATTNTLVNRYQLALFDIKLLIFDDFPFVKTALAQGMALEFLTGPGFFEWNNVAHETMQICILF